MKNLTEAEKSAYLVIYEDRIKRLEKQIKELKEENVKLRSELERSNSIQDKN